MVKALMRINTKVLALFCGLAAWLEAPLSAQDGVTWIRAGHLLDQALSPAYVLEGPFQESWENLLGRLPGLVLRNLGQGPEADLRGFGVGPGRLLVVVDGQIWNNPDMAPPDWNALAPSRIKRIVLEPGPQAAVWGGGAVSGVLRIETLPAGSEGAVLTLRSRADLAPARPEAAPGLEGGLAWEGPLGEGALAFDGAWFQNSQIRERSWHRGFRAGVQGLWPLGTELALRWDLQGQQTERAFPGGLTEAQAAEDPNQTFYGADGAGGRSAQVRLTAESELGPVTWRLPLSYRMQSSVNDFASLGFRRDLLWHEAQAAWEVRGGSAEGGGFVGLEASGRWYETGAGPLKQLGGGLYARTDWTLTAGWTLWTGGRLQGGLLGFGPELQPRWLWGGEAGTAWEVGDRSAGQWQIQVKGSRGGREPLVDEIYDVFLNAADLSLRPEIVWGLDGALLWSLRPWKLILSPFALWAEDEIVYQGRNQNLGRSFRIGGELQASWTETWGGLQVQGSWVRARDSQDQPVPLVSEWQGQVALQGRPWPGLELELVQEGRSGYLDAGGGEAVWRQALWPARIRVASLLAGESRLSLSLENLWDDRRPTATFGPWAAYPQDARRLRVAWEQRL